MLSFKLLVSLMRSSTFLSLDFFPFPLSLNSFMFFGSLSSLYLERYPNFSPRYLLNILPSTHWLPRLRKSFTCLAVLSSLVTIITVSVAGSLLSLTRSSLISSINFSISVHFGFSSNRFSGSPALPFFFLLLSIMLKTLSLAVRKSVSAESRRTQPPDFIAFSVVLSVKTKL